MSCSLLDIWIHTFLWIKFPSAFCSAFSAQIALFFLFEQQSAAVNFYSIHFPVPFASCKTSKLCFRLEKTASAHTTCDNWSKIISCTDSTLQYKNLSKFFTTARTTFLLRSKAQQKPLPCVGTLRAHRKWKLRESISAPVWLKTRSTENALASDARANILERRAFVFLLICPHSVIFFPLWTKTAQSFWIFFVASFVYLKLLCFLHEGCTCDNNFETCSSFTFARVVKLLMSLHLM